MMLDAALLLWAMMSPSSTDLAISPAQAINAVDWVTTEDYPRISIERGEAGTTGVTLHITASGRVDRCTVATSSGSSVLDVTTCALIQERARYEPAIDRNGRAVASTETQRVTWRIPKDEPSKIDWTPREMSVAIGVDVDIDDKGAVADCHSKRSGEASPDALATMLEQMGQALCVQIS